MDSSPLRVLLIEDDPDDYYLTNDLLSDLPGSKIVLDWASSFAAGREALARGQHDAYLLDFWLGKDNGLDLLREAIARGCSAPVIFVTGQEDRELGLQALREGAADYLVKGRFDAVALERSIRYALQQKRYADELEQKVQERTAELKRAEEVLRQADHRKDEFLAMLAHELRNPLAPLRNGLQVLRLALPKDPALEEVQGILERQVQHLVRLVDDLLELSRITSGKIELRKERVELANIVRNAVESSRPLIEQARHQLSVTIPDEPLLLDADSVRLTQVVSNLLNNAARYTPEGGQIWLSAQAGQELPASVELRVRDTGIGIAAEMLPRVFEMFTQLHRSPGQGGLGIGLSLVRSLVEMHGGSVRAQPRHGSRE